MRPFQNTQKSMKKKAFNFKRLSFQRYQPLKLFVIMLLIVKCMHPDDGDTQAPTAPALLNHRAVVPPVKFIRKAVI